METPPKTSGSAHQLTPVILSDNLVKLTPQKGNLTGNPRVVRDLVADLYNYVQAWNRHHLDGYRILKNIADLKIPILKNTQLGDSERVYPDGLQTLTDDLLRICDLMDATVAKMYRVARKMDTVVTLEKLHGKKDVPLFLTWVPDKFGESCKEICSAYDKELEVKQCVISEVSHSKNESELMLHLAAWVYQPCVAQNEEQILESLLKETGHR